MQLLSFRWTNLQNSAIVQLQYSSQPAIQERIFWCHHHQCACSNIVYALDVNALGQTWPIHALLLQQCKPFP